MGIGLSGKKIVIAGSRKTDEMSALISKQGGIPLVRSLQGTVFLADQQVEPELRSLIEKGADVLIFTTGIGTETLLELAEKISLKEQFMELIREADVASRGYKTYGVLKKLGVKPIAVDEDGTTAGLIKSLVEYDFSGKRVMIQLHGETAPKLVEFLTEKGASSITELLPYQHIAPERETVETLCKEICDHMVDSICFTTAIQVRSLLHFARENGYLQDLLKAFNESVLAAAVGKVTAEALREEGITDYLAPDIERMGAMIVELANYYKEEPKHK